MYEKAEKRAKMKEEAKWKKAKGRRQKEEG
jgi:hypothetical protein